MKLSKPALPLIAAIVFFVGVGAQGQEHAAPKAKASSVQLGDKVIVIPDPDGFEEAASQFPKYKERVLATESVDNDALLAHLPVKDCELLRAGQVPTYQDYTKVSILKLARELAVSRATMAEAVAGFRKNAGTYLDPDGPDMKKLLNKVEKGLSELDAKETKVDFSQPQILGEFDTRPDVNSFLLMMTVKIKSGAVEASVPTLASLSFVRANDRLLYVYVFKRYKAAAEIEAIKQFTTKWTSAILAAN